MAKRKHQLTLLVPKIPDGLMIKKITMTEKSEPWLQTER